MKRNLLILCTVLVATTRSAIALAGDTPPYLDPSQPLERRIDDLIARMTLEEKAAELDHKSSAIARLKIPMWGGWNQCLHGIWSKSRTTTLFPASIAMAATWDPDLVHAETTAISDEARAMYNIHEMGPQTPCGLVYRGPVINIGRNPLWGRIQESFGEDPFLTGRIAVAYVKGLQGDDPKYLKIAATLKHYAVNNVERDRMSLSAKVSERMLHEYWLPHFRDCVVEGHVTSMMAAYNAVNGVPCIANKLLLTDIPRGQWGFDGFIVCDLGGIGRLVDGHHLTSNMTVAVADALNAGCDYDDAEYRKHIVEAVNRKLLTEETVNRSLARVLRVAFRLGVFDSPDSVPYSKIDARAIDAPAHRALALKASRESIVLLSNKNAFLPLDRAKLKSVAAIGPAAENPEYGNYYHYNKVQRRVSPLQGLKNRLGENVTIRAARGCSFVGRGDTAQIAEAIAAAKGADVAILFLGTNLNVEAEGHDRSDMNLPGDQEKLLEAVYAVNPKTVVVLMNAGPLATRWAYVHVSAMLEGWYPGEEGGNAIADVLLGDYNPAGRLPYTVYESAAQVPPDTQYDISKGFTYMYLEGKPLFAFGHGLSYTCFAYTNLRVALPTVSVEVENTGTRAGDEVVQVYVHAMKSSVVRPIKELRGFQRVSIKPHEKKTVSFAIPRDKLACWDETTHGFIVESGPYDIMVGAASDDIRLQGQVEVK